MYMAKSLSEKVINCSITESQSLFQVPFWQISLQTEKLLPVEGAAHPATVLKETPPTQ